MEKNMVNLSRVIDTYLHTSVRVFTSALSDAALLVKVGEATRCINLALTSGQKLLIAGNGGSAADAQHFAAELAGRYRTDQRAYAALALTTDSSFLTAWGNDVSFRGVFARQLEALGTPGDVFFALSTSGESKNILDGLRTARRRGLKTIALLGKGGGRARDLADITIVVPSDVTSHVQECHIAIIHAMCEVVTMPI